MGAELLFVLMLMVDTGTPIKDRPLAATTTVIQANAFKTSIECQNYARDVNNSKVRAEAHGKFIEASLSNGSKGSLVGAWCNVLPAKGETK